MSLSPKKYISSYTNCTMERGVEAKNVEKCHANWDVTRSQSSEGAGTGGGDGEGGESSASLQHVEETASYLQVVVEKHRSGRGRGRGQAAEAGDAAMQTSPRTRLPSASSPLARAQLHQITQMHQGSEVYVVPHAVLLTCPAHANCPLSLNQALSYYTRNGGGGGVGEGPLAETSDPLPSRFTGPHPAPHRLNTTGSGDVHDLQKKNNKWRIFRDTNIDYKYDNEPERVEVYHLEQGAGTWLAACGGGGPTWCERAARRPGRVTQRALDELVAAGALAGRAPLALALTLARGVLRLASGAAAGAALALSDLALKPALALLHNAALQPLAVFVRAALGSLRAALHPLWAALADALEPPARLLAAVRLVDVRLPPHLPHRTHPAHPAHPAHL